MAEVKTGRGYVYSIQYHIVWCVKYRRKILFGEVEKSLKEIADGDANKIFIPFESATSNLADWALRGEMFNESQNNKETHNKKQD